MNRDFPVRVVFLLKHLDSQISEHLNLVLPSILFVERHTLGLDLHYVDRRLIQQLAWLHGNKNQQYKGAMGAVF
jgi:isocitrate dehydrogenase kinase/phosphatase